MITRSKTALRDSALDNIPETTKELKTLDKRWEFKTQIGNYNVYKLQEELEVASEIITNSIES